MIYQIFIWTTRSFDVYRIFLFVILIFTSTNFNKFFDTGKMEIIKIYEVQGQIMRWQDKFSKRITILNTRYLFCHPQLNLTSLIEYEKTTLPLQNHFTYFSNLQYSRVFLKIMGWYRNLWSNYRNLKKKYVLYCKCQNLWDFVPKIPKFQVLIIIILPEISKFSIPNPIWFFRKFQNFW